LIAESELSPVLLSIIGEILSAHKLGAACEFAVFYHANEELQPPGFLLRGKPDEGGRNNREVPF